MISRAERTTFGEWWWTVDRLLLSALFGLMLAGIVLSLAASPAVAHRIGLDTFHFVNRQVFDKAKITGLTDRLGNEELLKKWLADAGPEELGKYEM